MLSSEEKRAVAEAAIRRAEIQHLLDTRKWFVGMGPTRTGTPGFYYPEEGGDGAPVENVIAEMLVEKEDLRRRHEHALVELARRGGIVPGYPLDLWTLLKEENRELRLQVEELKMRAEIAESKIKPAETVPPANLTV